MRGLVDLAALRATGLATPFEEPTVNNSRGDPATAVEAWNGFVRISGGKFIEFEWGRFLARNLLPGEDSGMASSQDEPTRGFPRVNCNERSPAELPPPLYSPVELFRVVRGEGRTEVRLRTRQGA